jgi:RES domain-containing protein
VGATPWRFKSSHPHSQSGRQRGPQGHRSLAVAIAACGTTSVEGEFQRHVSPSIRTVTGSNAGGRWGPPGGYSVLYLGRPAESVIVEAYRHLVDDIDGMVPEAVKPRRLLTVDVRLSNVLDLRVAENRTATNLTLDDLRTDPGDYARCHRIGKVAHQLGLHGIIAPAATGLGETLAVFELHLMPHGTT